MCSFGQGVSLTPLQLGAYVAALANGGTLYYLQHPTTPEEASAFEPKVKRTLDIAKYVPDLQDGMAGAVEYGTARSLRANFHELPVFGKTGTCSDKGTRFGWFASYSGLAAGQPGNGLLPRRRPGHLRTHAAELTGVFYKNLWTATGSRARVSRKPPPRLLSPLGRTSLSASVLPQPEETEKRSHLRFDETQFSKYSLMMYGTSPYNGGDRTYGTRPADRTY